MKVVVSVSGKFHAFYLAQQLFKRGYLQRLITSHPKFNVKKYGIPRSLVSSIFLKEVVERGWNCLPAHIRCKANIQYFISDLFDRLASRYYIKSDICVAFSSCALHTLRKAKKEGAVTVLERGSTHILHASRILKSEYDKLQLTPMLPLPEIIEKELKEYQEADYISIPSLYVKKTFIENAIPENKLIVVPYGVDPDEFKPMNKTDDVFRIIYVGSMSIRKGLPYLLQAYAELSLPNFELLLVGGISGQIKFFFDRYKGHYKWVGSVPQKNLSEYYSQASVFVIMSLEEGMAMVQLQAMACGLPVICTAITGGEDIIRDGIDGFIIQVGDVKSLKEKIVYLYENRDKCMSMGQSAQQRVLAHFTWNDYGDRMVTHYKRILNEK